MRLHEIYYQLLSTYSDVPKLVIDTYVDNIDEQDYHITLVDYINYGIKSEFEHLTGIGILDGIETMIHDAIENGNIKLK